MSQFGNLKHIVDLETLLGWRLSKIDFSSVTDCCINYSWGDQKELIKWIHHKDAKQQFEGNFFTISGNSNIPIGKRKKYPLIWLSTPNLTGQSVGTGVMYRNVDIIIATDTKEEYLNSTRWKKHQHFLQAIGNEIIEKLGGGVKVYKDDGVLQYGYANKPNISADSSGEESKAIDLWDAVVINADLIVNKECRSSEYFNFCNK